MESTAGAPPVWVVRAGAGGALAGQCEEAGLIAIGFVEGENADGVSRDELTRRFRAGGSKGAGNAAGQLWRFANEIAVGDLVVVPVGGSRELLLGRVTGEYTFQAVPTIPGYPNVRGVEWLHRASRDLLPKRVLYSLGSLLTVFAPSGQAELRALALGATSPAASREDDIGVSDEAADEVSEQDLFKDIQARAAELIAATIANLDGYETQALVAGILRAMGYHTREAPPGADGGTDVLAARDALFVEPPILRVQVKARPNTKAGAPEIRELIGGCAQGEHGIFVATGGFVNEVLRQPSARVQLIDLARLQQLLLDFYDDLDQDTKALVPLRRIYFP